MSYDPSPKVQALQQRLLAFMDQHIYPNEARHAEEAERLGPWAVHPILAERSPSDCKEVARPRTPARSLSASAVSPESAIASAASYRWCRVLVQSPQDGHFPTQDGIGVN